MFTRLFKRRPCLLFVCTANLCRSPMAEGLCRAMAHDRNWEIISAGFFVDKPMPPHEDALLTLERHNINTQELVSTRLTSKLLRRATHIFTMTEMHLVSLRKQDAEALDRARLVTSFSTIPAFRDRDLDDPINGGELAFEQTYRVLSDAMPRIIEFVENG